MAFGCYVKSVIKNLVNYKYRFEMFFGLKFDS